MDIGKRINITVAIIFFVVYVLMVLMLPVLDTITRIILIGLLLVLYGIWYAYSSGKLALTARTRKLLGVPAAVILAGVGIAMLIAHNVYGAALVLLSMWILVEAFNLIEIDQS